MDPRLVRHAEKVVVSELTPDRYPVVGQTKHRVVVFRPLERDLEAKEVELVRRMHLLLLVAVDLSR